jgi:hypothetical protein
MFRTDNQVALNDALAQLYADNEPEFTAGYVTQMAVDMLNLLPKRQQKEYIKTVERFNGWHKVKVKNCLTGVEVEIPRADLGGPNDPSTERFHSM